MFKDNLDTLSPVIQWSVHKVITFISKWEMNKSKMIPFKLKRERERESYKKNVLSIKDFHKKTSKQQGKGRFFYNDA